MTPAQAALVRRAVVFTAVFAGGMTLVVRLSGGLFVEAPAAPSATATTSQAGADTSRVVTVGEGLGLGPGRGGRLDSDDIAVVGSRPVTWRRLTAEWATDTPEPSRDGARVRRLTDARLVFYPQPTEDDPSPAARESEPGVTILTGREAVVRQRERGPVAARLAGDCVATHLFGGGGTSILRSEVLDFRQERRGRDAGEASVLETDRPVRLEMDGTEATGIGLVSERDGAGERSTVRLLRDVQCLFRDATPGDRAAPRDVRIRSKGPAVFETLDRPARDGSQPWRATFRDDVVVDDGVSSIAAQQIVAEFVRTGEADRAAGARATEVQSIHATGGVRMDGRDLSAAAAGTSHVECESLRSFAQDDLTSVLVLEGHPVLRFHGKGTGGAASAYEIRCDGPVTARTRRASADPGAPAAVTFVCEGAVVVSETGESGALRAQLRAPRVTIEADRTTDGRTTTTTPRLFRAEKGAEAQFEGFAGRAETIVLAEPPASEPGGPRRATLTGAPVVSCAVAEGTGPFGGTEGAGRLVLSSDGRIDAEMWPEPPAGAPHGAAGTSTRTAVRTSGGMTARKVVGEDPQPVWELVAGDGDARVAHDGWIEDLHAHGGAILRRRGGAAGSGDLTGDRIDVARPAAQKGVPATDDARRRLDVAVRAAPGSPATAVFADTADAARRNMLQAHELVQTDDGRTLVARGAAHAYLHRSRDGASLVADADEIRATVERPAGKPAVLRTLACTGAVNLRNGSHQVTGDRVVYDPSRGSAEATGAPARLIRSADRTPLDRTAYPSYAAGPLVRAEFDPAAKGRDSFRSASLPLGGEIVDHVPGAEPERVTTTARGRIDVTPTSASCQREVVAVWEVRPRGAPGWLHAARIDCQRIDTTFAPGAAGKPPELRTFVATGTPDDPASLKGRAPAGDGEGYATAERIEAIPGSTRFRLSCPSDRTTVYFHDIVAGRRTRCDAVTLDYRTYEWLDLERERTVQ